MFASKSVIEHLLRGAVGVGAIAFAVTQSSPLIGFAALPIAMLAFRGCPSCWLIGLFETLSAKHTDRALVQMRCKDGSCARVETSTRKDSALSEGG